MHWNAGSSQFLSKDRNLKNLTSSNLSPFTETRQSWVKFYSLSSPLSAVCTLDCVHCSSYKNIVKSALTVCCAQYQHVSNDVLPSTASMSAVCWVRCGSHHTTPHHTHLRSTAWQGWGLLCWSQIIQQRKNEKCFHKTDQLTAQPQLLSIPAVSCRSVCLERQQAA